MLAEVSKRNQGLGFRGFGFFRWRGRFARFGFFRSDDFAGTAFGFDFRARGSAESMCADSQLAGEFAITEDFHAAGRPIGQAGTAQSGLIDSCPVFKLIEGIEVHGDVASRMTRVIESALGNTANERHLSAFKADSNRTAGAGGLAFTAAAAGLAMAAGFALAKALAAMLGTGTRFKIV